MPAQPMGVASNYMTATPILALVITPDGQGELRTIKQDIKTLQTTVGGYIQAIPCLFDQDETPQAMAWCNEESKLQDLPINHRATALWWALDDTMRGVDTLNGTAIFTGGIDRDGDVLPLPDVIQKVWATVDQMRP